MYIPIQVYNFSLTAEITSIMSITSDVLSQASSGPIDDLSGKDGKNTISVQQLSLPNATRILRKANNCRPS